MKFYRVFTQKLCKWNVFNSLLQVAMTYMLAFLALKQDLFCVKMLPAEEKTCSQDTEVA